MALPRRKVVSSYKSGSLSSNFFQCTLSCGHTVTAYGRAPSKSKHGFRYGVPEAPKTCECRRCAPPIEGGK